MTALNDGSTIGNRRRLGSPPVGVRQAVASGAAAAQTPAAPRSSETTPPRPPRTTAAAAVGGDGAGDGAGAGAGATRGNVDTSLRDRINRLSSARTDLMRKRGIVAADDDRGVAAPSGAAASVNRAPVTPEPVIDIDEPVVIDPTPEPRATRVDFTRPAAEEQPATAPAPEVRFTQEPAPEPMPEPVREAAPRRVAETPPEPAPRPHARQSARRRGDASKAEEGTMPQSDSLPATRRSTAPDVRRDQLREMDTEAGSDTAALAAEVKNLRREMAELRSEMRDLKDAGPGGLGPVERAVQRLAQRMDRLDGGGQPQIADGRLETRAPRKSWFFGLFGRR